MSGATRIAVRGAVAGAISARLLSESETGWLVSTSRKIDSRDQARVIRVMMLEGSISTNQVTSPDTRAQIVIQISSQLDDDDRLDEIGDYCHLAITENQQLPGLIKGVFASAFEYPIEEQDAYNDLVLTYTVLY